VAVVDGVYRHACPESAAILADAPAFHLELARTCGSLQCTHWHLERAVLVRVELRKMAAQYLFPGVTLDAFRAGIPVYDVAREIEHVDGVVGNAFDQQAKPPFRLGQFASTLPRALLE